MPDSNDPAPLEVVPSEAPASGPPAPETEEQAEERKGRGKGELSKEVIAGLLALNPDEHAGHVKAGQKELWEILHRQMKKEAKNFAPRELVIAYGILTDKLMAPVSAPQQLHQHNTVVINGLSRKDALKALGVATKGKEDSKEPNYIVPLPRPTSPARGLLPASATTPARTPITPPASDYQSPAPKAVNV